MSEIKSALTPEEWAKLEVRRGTQPSQMLVIELDRDDGLVCHDDYHGPGTAESEDERHALAALALHGQPFGFTWEDVDLILGLRGRPSEIDGDPFTDDDPALERLAARIAALLPPRER